MNYLMAAPNFGRWAAISSAIRNNRVISMRVAARLPVFLKEEIRSVQV
jgi:hypothetical protein